ncbi:hypothetical protein R1sor_027083 [Riccia sorocarpa]|uniref:Uncharacterized protein n=1 Tax=Riccia sorocarpa TaxID=122646 RepID=A0ABD3GGC9_9MARC
MKSSPAVKVEKDALHFTSGSSCMPEFLDLKNDLAVRESRVEVLRADITRMIAVIEASRISLKSAEKTISNAETRYKQESDVRDKLEHNRAALAEKKQALEIRLEDGGFDEENPEDMKLLQTLELQEEELVLTYSAALTALEESNKRLKDLQTDLKLGRTSAEKLNVEITAAKIQIVTSQSALTREESTVEAQKEELNVLQPFAESKIAALNPTFVPIATEVTKKEYRQEWEHNTELQKQRDAFRVERTWRVSDATTKARDASPSSTIISSREEEKDSDLCIMEVNHVPLTRSKKGKRRAVEKADLSRKVQTMSYVTEAEMSTGIGSPYPYKAGQEIFRMTGQEFFDKYGIDVSLLHQFVSSHLAGTPWAITVIGYPFAGEYFRALSFSRAGGKSPKSEMVIGTPSSRAARPQAVRPEAVDTSGTLSSVGSSSLGVLMRMKTRVDSLGKDIAEAIAAVKLEQEEEFVDSASDWAQ